MTRSYPTHFTRGLLQDSAIMSHKDWNLITHLPTMIKLLQTHNKPTRISSLITPVNRTDRCKWSIEHAAAMFRDLIASKNKGIRRPQCSLQCVDLMWARNHIDQEGDNRSRRIMIGIRKHSKYMVGILIISVKLCLCTRVCHMRQWIEPLFSV